MKPSKNPVLIPRRERLVSAEVYLQEMSTHKDFITEVQFMPPRLGEKGFGSFRVSYSSPVLLPAGEK